jgi:hypothetical protein
MTTLAERLRTLAKEAAPTAVYFEVETWLEGKAKLGITQTTLSKNTLSESDNALFRLIDKHFASLKDRLKAQGVELTAQVYSSKVTGDETFYLFQLLE